MRWASTAFCSRSITRSPKTRPAPNDCRRPPFDMPALLLCARPYHDLRHAREQMAKRLGGGISPIVSLALSMFFLDGTVRVLLGLQR